MCMLQNKTKHKKMTKSRDKRDEKKNKCLHRSHRNYCNYFVVITFISTVIKNECKMQTYRPS